MNSEFRRTQPTSAGSDHFRRLERMYLTKANINDYFNPSIAIGDGEAEIRIEVDPKFFHAAGAVHGTVYFKALDDAAFFAANSVVEDVFVLTTNFNIQLLRPVTEGILIAKGTLVSKTRSLLVADAELRDDRDRFVGRGTGNFMKSRVRLEDIQGYAD